MVNLEGQLSMIFNTCKLPLPLITATFEVYVRRAYKAYTLLSIDYEEGDTLDDGEAPSAVTWRFNLGQSHSPPDTPRISKGYVQTCPSHR